MISLRSRKPGAKGKNDSFLNCPIGCPSLSCSSQWPYLVFHSSIDKTVLKGQTGQVILLYPRLPFAGLVKDRVAGAVHDRPCTTRDGSYSLKTSWYKCLRWTSVRHKSPECPVCRFHNQRPEFSKQQQDFTESRGETEAWCVCVCVCLSKVPLG